MKELEEFMSQVQPVKPEEVKKPSQKPKTVPVNANNFSVSTNYFIGVGTVVETSWHGDDNMGEYAYFKIQFSRNNPDSIGCRVRDQKGMEFVRHLELGVILEVQGKLRYDKATRQNYIDTRMIHQDPKNNGDFVSVKQMQDLEAGHGSK